MLPLIPVSEKALTGEKLLERDLLKSVIDCDFRSSPWFLLDCSSKHINVKFEGEEKQIELYFNENFTWQ